MSKKSRIFAVAKNKKQPPKRKNPAQGTGNIEIMTTLEYLNTDLGAKFFDFCAYIVKTELPNSYLYECVTNKCTTHAIIKETKLEDAKRILSQKGFYLAKTR